MRETKGSSLHDLDRLDEQKLAANGREESVRA
jgi:hypothetical protein